MKIEEAKVQEKADAAKAVDVGVIDPRQESNFRGCHRVVVWQEELELEHAPCSRVPRVSGKGTLWLATRLKY